MNGIVDTWLSTFGYGGKAISAIKNSITEYYKQKDKGWTADHMYTMLQLLSFSPPIGSKARKIYSAIQTEKFNEGVSKKRGFTLDNPMWSLYGNLIEGVTNIPLGRLSNKMLNLDNAMDSNNKWWQRVALVMGWNTWDLGIKDPDIVKAKGKIKEEQSEKSDIKKEEKKKNKLKEKYPDKSNKEIEIILKSKELFDLSKQQQVDVLEALDLNPKHYPKEQDRCDKIAELYNNNSKLIERIIKESKNKPKEEKKKGFKKKGFKKKGFKKRGF